MALADFDTLRNLLAVQQQSLTQVKSTPSLANGMVSAWLEAAIPLGVAPTTAVTCSNSTTGALTKTNAGSGRQIVISGNNHHATEVSSALWTAYLLIDRLSHQGGLSGNITTLQTTNLPTAALTRYTSGVGVMAAIEVHANAGSTNTVATVIYTNTTPTGSRTVFVAIDDSPSDGVFLPIPLVAGDVGVTSVESFQLSAATGSAGDIGITLYKPLAMIFPRRSAGFDVLSIAGWNEEILDDACLQLVSINPNISDEQHVTLNLAEC